MSLSVFLTRRHSSSPPVGGAPTGVPDRVCFPATSRCLLPEAGPLPVSLTVFVSRRHLVASSRSRGPFRSAAVLLADRLAGSDPRSSFVSPPRYRAPCRFVFPVPSGPGNLRCAGGALPIWRPARNGASLRVSSSRRGCVTQGRPVVWSTGSSTRDSPKPPEFLPISWSAGCPQQPRHSLRCRGHGCGGCATGSTRQKSWPAPWPGAAVCP